MTEPEQVAACVAAMTRPARRRAGDGEMPDRRRRERGLPFLARFVATVAAAGCRDLRRACAQGLAEGAEPEAEPRDAAAALRGRARLKQAFPQLEIMLNGGLRTPAAARAQLAHVDGVMIGREAYENPWSLAAFQAEITGAPHGDGAGGRSSRPWRDYLERQARAGVPDRAITRHMLGLFNGLPGARAWRRRLTLAEGQDGPGLLRSAANLVPAAAVLAA